MSDPTSPGLLAATAAAFRDHGVTAAITALIGGFIALFAAVTRRAFTNEALLQRLDREARDCSAAHLPPAGLAPGVDRQTATAARAASPIRRA